MSTYRLLRLVEIGLSQSHWPRGLKRVLVGIACGPTLDEARRLWRAG